MLFILLLGGLTFLGYCVAKSLGDLQNRPEPESSLPESSLVSEIVPPDEPSSAPESSAPAAEEEEIDTSSGATITTSAVTDAVNAGLCAFRILES